jgi:hypothetical protein
MKSRLIPTTDPELIALCDNQSQRQHRRHGYVVMRDRPGTFVAWVRAEVVRKVTPLR